MCCALLLLALLPACSDHASGTQTNTGVENCGGLTVDDEILDSTTTPPFNASGTATGVSAGTRVYSWSFLLARMCVATALADNVTNLQVILADTTPATVTVSGEIDYATATTTSPTFVSFTHVSGSSTIHYTGQLAGFNPSGGAIGATRADIIITVQVAFPTLGSSAADRAFLEPLLKQVRVTTYYHPYTGD